MLFWSIVDPPSFIPLPRVSQSGVHEPQGLLKKFQEADKKFQGTQTIALEVRPVIEFIA